MDDTTACAAPCAPFVGTGTYDVRTGLCDCDEVPQLPDVCDIDCQLQSLRVELPATGGTAVTISGGGSTRRRLRRETLVSHRAGGNGFSGDAVPGQRGDGYARRMQEATTCAQGNSTACGAFESVSSPLLVAVPQPDGSTTYVRLDGILNPLISSFTCQPLLRDGIDPSSPDASDALAAQDGSNSGISAASADGSVTTFSARTCDMQSMVMQSASAGGGFVGIYGLPPALRLAIAEAIAAESSSTRRLEDADVDFSIYGGGIEDYSHEDAAAFDPADLSRAEHGALERLAATGRHGSHRAGASSSSSGDGMMGRGTAMLFDA